MSKSINPATAVAVIVVVLVGAIGMVMWRGSQGPGGTQVGQTPAPMPADVQAEFQKRMGGKGGITGPPSQSLPGAPRMGR